MSNIMGKEIDHGTLEKEEILSTVDSHSDFSGEDGVTFGKDKKEASDICLVCVSTCVCGGDSNPKSAKRLKNKEMITNPLLNMKVEGGVRPDEVSSRYPEDDPLDNSTDSDVNQGMKEKVITCKYEDCDKVYTTMAGLRYHVKTYDHGDSKLREGGAKRIMRTVKPKVDGEEQSQKKKSDKKRKHSSGSADTEDLSRSSSPVKPDGDELETKCDIIFQPSKKSKHSSFSHGFSNYGDLLTPPDSEDGSSDPGAEGLRSIHGANEMLLEKSHEDDFMDSDSEELMLDISNVPTPAPTAPGTPAYHPAGYCSEVLGLLPDQHIFDDHDDSNTFADDSLAAVSMDRSEWDFVY